VTTVHLNAEIPASRELRITLPPNLPEGPSEIVVVISTSTPSTATFHDLAQSEFFGMWLDRPDITDRVAFAEDLRASGSKRSTYGVHQNQDSL
jgi:hypothetical protein